MKLVIIESPFAGETDADVAANVVYARACMRHSLGLGEAPFASHLLYTQQGILDDRAPTQRELGIAVGHEWLKRADLVAVYTDLGISPGMQRAIDLADLRDIGVVHRKLSYSILLALSAIIHCTYGKKFAAKLHDAAKAALETEE